MNFAQATTPARKYGLIYSGNEDNATNTIKQVEEYLKKIGVEYVEKTAPTAADVENATNALIAEKVDAVFVPNDSIIRTVFQNLQKSARTKKFQHIVHQQQQFSQVVLQHLQLTTRESVRKQQIWQLNI